MKNILLILLLLVITSFTSLAQIGEKDHWRFVSMPDFLNVDTDYPQAGWEDALSYILKSVKNENPDFLLVAGDLVMGRWHNEYEKPGIDGIKYFASRYYPAWKARMEAHNLHYYTSIGDHEIGDNPWDYKKQRPQ